MVGVSMIQGSIGFRQLTEDKDLLHFAEFTSHFIGVDYPLEYLRRSQVTAMVSQNGAGEVLQVLGGYIIAVEGPFRVIAQLPPGVVDGHGDLQARLDKALELTGLWIHPVVKGGRTRFKFWWQLFMDVLKENMKGRSHFVYSYDADKDKLQQMYSLSRPQRIYRGPVFIEGMRGESEEIVEIGSTKAVCWAFMARPICISRFITKRLFRRKNFLGKVAKA
ncbi:MAG TPA: hypothetical protein PL182_07500 [Pseudobdellovibrionaceae bacterium]|nr:hypothetical protein [Pseudobdellovibrionaceae bacterium]